MAEKFDRAPFIGTVLPGEAVLPLTGRLSPGILKMTKALDDGKAGETFDAFTKTRRPYPQDTYQEASKEDLDHLFGKDRQSNRDKPKTAEEAW